MAKSRLHPDLAQAVTCPVCFPAMINQIWIIDDVGVHCAICGESLPEDAIKPPRLKTGVFWYGQDVYPKLPKDQKFGKNLIARQTKN